MFEIEYSDFGEFKQVKVFNKEKAVSFSLFPECGAMLNQVELKGKLLLWGNKDYDNLISEGKRVYKGSKLFPFPNRINEGTYLFKNEKYQLPVNFPNEGHAIHGLVLESKFKIKDIKLTEAEGAIVVEYDYNKEFIGFPFEFHLEIIFEISEEGFRCKTLVKNMDDKDIPLGDGWHPYFKIESKMEEVLIQVPSKEEIEVDDRKIPTGKVTENIEIGELKKIGDRKFDTCFKFKENSGISVVKLIEGNKEINIWMESGKDQYQYVQVYIPPARDSIAIEPMTCWPDAFNNHNGLIVIPSGHSRSFLWGINMS